MTFKTNGYVGINRVPSYRLDVNGNIRVNTTIYSSDERLKENISDLSFNSNILYNLRSVEYYLKNQDTGNIIQETETMNPNKIIEEQIIEDNRIHYGFIAQEVQNILPELVYEDAEGYLGIDYISFIPLLVEEIKLQKISIENLKLEIEDLKQSNEIATSIQSNDSFAKLFQNYPNPFNHITTIKFYLSSSISVAYIYIYDMQGYQMRSYSINQRENAKVEIKSSDLKPGMYMYSLIADGSLIDTKTMILTD